MTKMGASSLADKQFAQKTQRGHLKIFFGYAAGVGKTYQMLEEAQQLKKQGVDVVVGYVEPLARPDTMALLQGLEQINQKMIYKGMTVNEFDLQAALKRHPQVLLVDELAHTDVNQTFHEKRYQDIEACLAAVIDVYTTMNVQHLESLNNLVENYTHVHVRERVPDDFFDQADQIKLVDIDPKDLIDRMKQGKIYQPVMAKRALANFFTIGNLTALREIALRRMTMRLSSRRDATEKLLVCFSGSPTSQTVLRSAAQLGHAFSGNVYALYIYRNSVEKSLPKSVQTNVRLAESLGMSVTTLYGEHRGELITEYCKTNSITKLVLGAGNTSLLARLRYGGSLIDQLNQALPKIDKYVIPHQGTTPKPKWQLKWQNPNRVFRNGLYMLLILSVSTLIGAGLVSLHVAASNLVLIYILGVMVTAVITTSQAISVLAAVLSVLVYNYFFTYPYGSLVSGQENIVTFVMMGIVGLLSGSWATRLQHQASAETQRARRIEILFEMSHKLETAQTLNDVLLAVGKQVQQLLNRDIIIYPRDEDQLGIPYPLPLKAGAHLEGLLSPDERAVAVWTLKNNHVAGRTTDTLPKSVGLYLPITGSDAQAIAVLGVHLNNGVAMDPFTWDLLTSIINISALAIQRIQAADAKKAANEQMRQETTRANLLRGISHDLRTPLTTISGNADILRSQDDSLTPTQRHSLYQSIYNDAIWLRQVVENLLAMTRVQAGKLEIHSQPELIGDIIEAALGHVSPGSEEHQINTQLKDDLLMVKVDAQLIMQVIINIVNNAILYTQKGSIITISADRQEAFVRVTITNNGPHLSTDTRLHMFDLFYSKQQAGTKRHGMGIGLALCQTIIHASGGEIGVYNQAGPVGVTFYFTVPYWEVQHGQAGTDSIS